MGRDDIPTLRVVSSSEEPSEPSEPARAPDAPDPRRVGRYTVLRRLGEGGMGRVHLAYDPELDRNIAIKIMPRHPLRLRREAQAMAKLSHPNVATVFEVGWDDHGTAYVAMEFIEGTTLRSWLDARPRSVSEVLAVLVAAGRGLAAAHARGIVHRDFKPQNVMVSRDGAVKVLDFGLAVSPGDTDGNAREHTGELGARPSSSTTRTGQLLGTPAYMSPEHHRGDVVDAKSDQFAFCVTMYEALWGVRPFAGSTLEELSAHVRAGTRVSAARPASVPRWLEALVERGLATDPRKRWPSMDELLHVIETASTRSRRRTVLVGVAGAIAIAGGLVAAWQIDRAQDHAACEREAQAIRTVWNPDVAATVHASLTSTGVSHAASTSERLGPVLDAWTERWTAARQTACERADIDRTWTSEVGQASRTCLDEHRWALEELLESVLTPDATTVHRALQAAILLPDVEACADEAKMLQRPRPPADATARAEVEALARRLAVVERLEDTGRSTEALAEARRVSAEAQRIGHAPFVARAHYVLGRMASDNGAYADAERAFETGLQIAIAAGDEDVVGAILTELVLDVGLAQARVEDGRRWGALAQSWLSRRDRTDPLRRAMLLNNLCLLARGAGEFGEAQRACEEALALREATVGTDHPAIATSLVNLAALHGMQGRHAEAEALVERAVAVLEHAFGPEHPDVASSLLVLANLRLIRASYDEAWPLFERARTLYVRAYGEDHPDLANVLDNMAIVRAQTGALEEARTLELETLRIREKVLGREHPMVARGLSNLARIEQQRGDLDEAERVANEAVAIVEHALDPEHPELADALSAVADIVAERGDVPSARATLQRVLAIRKSALQQDDPKIAETTAALRELEAAEPDR